jgi:DNA-binding SARP family transcriptional activator
MPNLQEWIDQAYHTLQQQTSQVILLHPQSRYRSLLLAKLINDPTIKTFYYALDPDDISVETFIESLSRNLASQHPPFGRYLNVLPNDIYQSYHANEELIVTTFARELEHLSNVPFLFLLDEFDRSDIATDINRFVECLANYLPAHCKLVINGRTLPRLPWVAMIAKRQATLLLDDAIVERDFYGTLGEGDAYDLVTTTLGPGQVRVNDAHIEGWEGHLPRLLLFFALDRPIVTRYEICHAFWPDLDEDQAVNVFHVTKRRLHKALDKDVLVHNDTHYRVNPALNVYYDVLEFVEKLMEGRNAATSNKIEAWKRVIELYNGPFLQGHNEKWIVERRNAYATGYVEALNHVADHWVEKDRPEIALKFYEQAIVADNTREDVHRNLMQLYAQMGRRSEAIAHYQTIEKIFRDKHLSISGETTALLNEIMS